MNKITINGILRKGEGKYDPGHVYLLDVTRKSGTVDTLLLLHPDDKLPEGSVHVEGHLEAAWLRGIGTPAYIIADSVEPIEGMLEALSEAVITGTLKEDLVFRTTHGGKGITTLKIKTEKGQIPAILWGKTAKNAVEKYHAGDMVIVTGRLQSREYPDKKTGGTRTTYELSGNTIEDPEDE